MLWRFKILFGDWLFGLEVARRRFIRILSSGELLRLLFRLPPLPGARDGKPGRVAISLDGLAAEEVADGAAGEMPFVQTLFQRERYRVSREADPREEGTDSETESPGLDPARSHPLSVRRAAVELARGAREVHCRLNAGLPAEMAGANRLRAMDARVRRLFLAAHRSRYRDYDVRIHCRPAVGGAGFTIGPADGRRRLAIAAGPWSPDHLRVMTWNVHSCVGVDGRYSVERVARVIRGYAPDVVALQEVDVRRSRSQGQNQPYLLARRLGMHPAFCHTVKRSGEEYGHLLLTRVPVEMARSGLLGAGVARDVEEPRGALLVRIQIGGGRVWVLNTHLGLTAAQRREQTRTLLGTEWLGAVPSTDRVVLCADLNAGPGSEEYRELKRVLRDVQVVAGDRPAPTFPSSLPMARIDHIFCSANVEVAGLEVSGMMAAEVASDHLPLVADLKWGGGVGG